MESKDKLSALKNDFDLWRSERKKGTPVPDHLKKNACSLLSDHDISTTSLVLVAYLKTLSRPGIII